MKNQFKKKQGLDYRFAENPDGKEWGAIRITSGELKELTYHYGVVSFDEKDDGCQVNFTYNIVDNPRQYPEGDEMKDAMGSILIELLEQRYGSEANDDDRDDYTVQLNTE